MNIDLGSFAYGSTLENGSGTPSWGTALGQSSPEYYMTKDGNENIIMGMVYCSVPLKSVSLPLGKGGKIYDCLEAGVIQIASLFKNVYVNGIKIKYPFIMVLQKEDTASHSGRRSIKYSDKAIYKLDGVTYSNRSFVDKVYEQLDLEEDACWFVYDIDVKNHEELHMKAIIVDKESNWEYYDSKSRSEEWMELIKDAGDEYVVNKEYNTTFVTPCTLQQIFYGAPGTGKSFSISENFALTEDNTFRTTFHPDTDYASFVGCYKPQSYKKNILDGNGYNEEQIVNCLFNSDDQNAYPQSIKARYWYEVLVNAKDIKKLELSPKELADKVRAKGFKSTAYEHEAGCMLKIYDWLKEDNYLTSSNISYSFSPQVFTRAYIKAWEKHATNEPVFLVIDEINRGNCAQIFGDLFQLLDRDVYGYSDYEIKPDADLQNYIAVEGNLSVSGIKDKKGNDISKSINDGSLLKLPNNLYILATMNTSDQSLFPMDSAFKRRWTWKYVKIEEPKEDDDKMFIELDGKDGETVQKPWIEVITTINTYIKRKQKSSDKQIGYWFVKSDCKVEVDDGAGNKKPRKGISIDQFRDKVLFFLFDDAFKDDEDFASLFGSTDYLFVDLFDEGNIKAKVSEVLDKMEE